MRNVKYNQNYHHIFYSVVGKHAGEQVGEIIERKQKEIDLCGFSLWSAKIDKKSVEQVWKLEKEDKVYVLCRININAKDPVEKTETPYYAQKAFGPIQTKFQEIVIPDSIKTSFTRGSNYQAYVVEKYELLVNPIQFELGKYVSILSNNTSKSFKDRFDCSRFQNTYGFLNELSEDSCIKEIGLIMELRYPFVVNLE